MMHFDASLIKSDIKIDDNESLKNILKAFVLYSGLHFDEPL